MEILDDIGKKVSTPEESMEEITSALHFVKECRSKTKNG